MGYVQKRMFNVSFRGRARPQGLSWTHVHIHRTPAQTLHLTSSSQIIHISRGLKHTAQSVFLGVGCWALGQCVLRADAWGSEGGHADRTRTRTHVIHNMGKKRHSFLLTFCFYNCIYLILLD